MARFTKESDARANAQANANANRCDYALFSDTSGAWNSEPWGTRGEGQTWAGVRPERIQPIPLCKGCGKPVHPYRECGQQNVRGD